MNYPVSLREVPLAPLPRTPGDEWGTQVQLFEEIFLVFLVLGTVVGVVVVTYTLYNAYRYRDRGEAVAEADRPTLGELPSSEGGGRKLFLSFAISAVIVLGLIGWTYGALLYVEAGPTGAGEDLEVTVVGFQFGWEFEYPNGHTTNGELRVPADRVVTLTVTSNDVWHSFGIPDLKVKADAIPGQTTETWFVAEETGQYQAWCYELCGVGHSQMQADVIVMEPDEFEQWYEDPEAYEEAEGNDAQNRIDAADGTDGSNAATHP
ncbi:cytochrome c oxidase subunit II [Halalkalicoccus sp. NIPERK01]|uniref:cytochrome c oxidase subunit II n=1 Tax=Halalkalicoccus sp. NIPERK01 TaxID=3053469 RepID=UPI00256EB736|nr:cytochrome c oxidase subunit II [Halalkalicoccus sp. NIPERK01]MDL5361076.1 cytochrome c oxidase subunit II [Halalkalicoccus sp. NIPERK01]